MYTKRLTTIGNSSAIILDKSILAAAQIKADAIFAITVSPSGGLTIQSVESENDEVVMKSFKKVMKKHRKVIERLVDK